MSLKRISEIGIFIALAMFLKAGYFLIWPAYEIGSFFLENQTLLLFLDYGILVVFQVLLIIYLRKKEFQIAFIAWIVFFLVNTRYIYVFTNYDFSDIADNPNALTTIRFEVLILNISSLAAASSLVITNARSELFLRLYGYINVVMNILLFRQISTPRMDILQAVQIIGTIAPVFILAQYAKERWQLNRETLTSDSDLLDDAAVVFGEEE